MRINLPSGATAEMQAPDKLKARHQRAVSRAISKADQREGAFVIDLTDGVLAIVVQDWTVTDDDGNPLPLPSEDFSVIDELDLADYEALLSHPFVEATTKKLMELRAERISPDDYNDPQSPSEPSGESKHASTEGTSATTSRGPGGTTRRSMSPSRTGGAGRRKS